MFGCAVYYHYDAVWPSTIFNKNNNWEMAGEQKVYHSKENGRNLGRKVYYNQKMD